MADVMGPLARRLAELPIGDGLVAGPSFELVELGADPVATVRRAAGDAVAAEPRVEGVVSPLLEADTFDALLAAGRTGSGDPPR
jgi:hypothetical protein